MGPRNVFVTGGAGFIGSNFVYHLLDALPDTHVTVYDKLTYAGNMENFERVKDNPRFSFVYGDICDAQAVHEAMRSSDMVVHFAAETHVDRSILVGRNSFMQTNIQGTVTLLEAAQELDIERFLHVSTVEVYGNTAPSVSSRHQFLEDDCLNPLSPYASSKAAADRLAYSYWTTFKLPVVITRCVNNYGPYQYPEKQIPLFITNALQGRPLPVHGDGLNTRNWIHVEDHCKALLAILNAPAEAVVGEVFNIGNDEEHNVIDNANTILRLVGVPPYYPSSSLIAHVPDRQGAVRRLAVDATKLRERLGWTPQIPFEDGLASTVQWYIENEAWLKHVLERGDAFLNDALNRGVGKTSDTPEPSMV
ncbi:MAG: dTDP-glucose 4,6-dehydratase [Ktedonobacteraceae bacterium]